MKHFIFLGTLLLAGLIGSAAAESSWQEEWERVLQAAKKEGRVAVIGPSGTHRRDALSVPFEKKYGIKVFYWGARGSGITPRIGAERRAKRYMWDVNVTGTTTALTSMIPWGAYDPLEPALILPEVKDPKNWRGGGLEFVTPHRMMHVMTLSQHATLFINPNLVKPKEITSYKDLLDPKWKGKIVLDDPRKPGPGLGTFTFLFMHPDLGPDFIRALGRQKPLVLRNYRQELDLVAQGKYPILMGTSGSTAEARIKQGLPIAIIDPRQLKEGSDVSPQAGAVALFNRAPHPNAAKIYLNWLLSKEGQTVFARATGYISARLDVPTDHAPWRVPIPGSIKTYTAEVIKVKKKLMPLLAEVFGRR